MLWDVVPFWVLRQLLYAMISRRHLLEPQVTLLRTVQTLLPTVDLQGENRYMA
jgi:hypothetical protein